MKKPKIGVLPLYDGEKNVWWMLHSYMTAVEQAGGVPFMLPQTTNKDVLDSLLEMADGLIFTGGQDIEPTLYGEEKQSFCGPVDPLRDEMEALLFQMALAQNKPLFGTCRGIQMINTMCGGTLYQDLPQEHPGEITHSQEPPYDQPVHSVAVTPESPLQRIVGIDTLQVNSFHHQAIKTLGPSLSPMAQSPDGLIEAVYMPDRPFVMAVQWHPEWMMKEDEPSRRIFHAFLDACMQ